MPPPKYQKCVIQTMFVLNSNSSKYRCLGTILKADLNTISIKLKLRTLLFVDESN